MFVSGRVAVESTDAFANHDGRLTAAKVQRMPGIGTGRHTSHPQEFRMRLKATLALAVLPA
jgi:hypothetical protein